MSRESSARGTKLPVAESLVYEAWPSIGMWPSGRWVGKLWETHPLLSIAGIPVALALYFRRLIPWVARRYRITTSRVVVVAGFPAREVAALDFDAFDSVEIERLPGQAGLRCGDVVFRQAGREVFRLPAVWIPETFLANCERTKKAVESISSVLNRPSAESETVETADQAKA
ncbi:hypothetical protein JCM19992_33090 [Thermostilla marina]